MPEEELIISKEYGAGALSGLALVIRRKVFVDEQNVPLELELDDFDASTTHYIGFTGQAAVTTARVLVTETGAWHIQRVATLPEYRGHGYSSKIMQTIMEDAHEAGVSQLELGAQLVAQTFYEKLGFTPVGETFLDAGIEHIEMIFTIN
ncbi:MAG: GNAT family N-acetyltransferase [Lactobacillaceae bacterium]|jgi:predicted GNAT family N-acyltransferase|nr:GNAT family N-acetyltransferase [Lactobacillaceae bacterium]